MKIILSRKGLDSGTCKVSNLIIDNQKFCMFPIPDDKDQLRYKDIKTYKNIFTKLYKNSKYKQELSPEKNCHIDPNIQNFLNEQNFLGSLGQVDSAQTQLDEQNISKNDIFLFWGLFSKANKNKTELEFSNYFKNRHTIFGFLQIGDIIKTYNLTEQERNQLEIKYPWLKNHPHWNNKKYILKTNNTIYVAKRNGYGLFKFNDKLVLSSPNSCSRSNWTVKELANCKFKNYKNLVFNENGEIKMPNRGQEFVLNDPKAKKWAENLIKKFKY